MPIAWFICPYIVKNNPSGWPYYKRWPALHDAIADISADGGTWAASEKLGNYCVAKVRASETTLAKIASMTGVVRLTKTALSTSLSDLTTAQKNAIRNKLEDMGYTTQNIRDALGTDLSSKTLADVLKFAASKRLTPRFDKDIGEMVLDGNVRSTKPIEDVDKEVSA